MENRVRSGYAIRLLTTELSYALSVLKSAMLLTHCCPMVLRRYVFNLRNALNDYSAERVSFQRYVPHYKTLETYQIYYSRALSSAFLEQSRSLIRALDENLRTFSAQLRESRRRFCKI